MSSDVQSWIFIFVLLVFAIGTFLIVYYADHMPPRDDDHEHDRDNAECGQTDVSLAA